LRPDGGELDLSLTFEGVRRNAGRSSTSTTSSRPSAKSSLSTSATMPKLLLPL